MGKLQKNFYCFKICLGSLSRFIKKFTEKFPSLPLPSPPCPSPLLFFFFNFLLSFLDNLDTTKSCIHTVYSIPFVILHTVFEFGYRDLFYTTQQRNSLKLFFFNKNCSKVKQGSKISMYMLFPYSFFF